MYVSLYYEKVCLPYCSLWLRYFQTFLKKTMHYLFCYMNELLLKNDDYNASLHVFARLIMSTDVFTFQCLDKEITFPTAWDSNYIPSIFKVLKNNCLCLYI